MSSASKYHVTESQMAEEMDWIEAAKQNPKAFEKLYNKYHEQIFRFVYQRVEDKDQAFDTTSQIFLKAMLNLYRYEFRGLPFASWLYRIAANEVKDYYKKSKSTRIISIETTHLYELMDDLDHADTGEKEKMKQQVIKAIAGLPDTELQLIEMRFFEQRAFREIGEILDMTENNAKVKLYRTLEKIRKMITAKAINQP